VFLRDSLRHFFLDPSPEQEHRRREKRSLSPLTLLSILSHDDTPVLGNITPLEGLQAVATTNNIATITKSIMMTDDNNPEEVTPVEKEEAPPAVETTHTPSPKSKVKMTRTDSGGVDADFGKFHLEVEAKQVPLVGYFLASFIFMIASLAQKEGLGKGWYGYAVSIGVLGMCFSLAGMVLLKYKSEFDQIYLAYGLVVWAIIGACFMTFGGGPFSVTGNGALFERIVSHFSGGNEAEPLSQFSFFLSSNSRILCRVGHGHFRSSTLRCDTSRHRKSQGIEFSCRLGCCLHYYDCCHFLRGGRVQ
jgi:hypothetical protein